MKAHLALVAALAIVAATTAGAAPRKPPLPQFKPRPVSITLPDTSDEHFPARPGLAAVEDNCRTCHSPSMVLTQHRLTGAEWTAEIAKMRNVYKAPIEDSAVPDLLLYLAGPEPKQP